MAGRLFLETHRRFHEGVPHGTGDFRDWSRLLTSQLHPRLDGIERVADGTLDETSHTTSQQVLEWVFLLRSFFRGHDAGGKFGIDGSECWGVTN